MVADPKQLPDNDAVACGYHTDTTDPWEQVTSTVPQLQLLAIRSSGKQWEIETFQRKLLTSFVSPRETQQHLDMKGHSESGKTIEAKGMLIPLLQMWRMFWISFMVCLKVDVGIVAFE